MPFSKTNTYLIPSHISAYFGLKFYQRFNYFCRQTGKLLGSSSVQAGNWEDVVKFRRPKIGKLCPTSTL